MDADEIFIPILISLALLMFLIGLGIGASNNKLTKLNNGCIVYKSNTYCEVEK